MKRIWFFCLLLVIIFSFGVQAETITMRLADNQPEGYPTVIGAREFARLVKERTNGRIKIELYPGGILGDEQTVIEQLQFGAIDLTRISTISMATFEPAMNVLALPYLYPSGDYMFDVLLSDVGEGILEGLEPHGIVGLTWYDAGARSFYTRKTLVNDPEDLNGLRIRVLESQMYMDLVSALGGSATPIPWGDVYSALQTGVVDAAENNFPGWYANSHHEVAPYFVVDEHSRIPELIIMSKITWDSLSKEDQEIIKQAAVESTAVQRKAWAKMEKEAEENALEQGATVTYLAPEQKDAFREAVMHLYPEYSKGYEDLVDSILNFGN